MVVTVTMQPCILSQTLGEMTVLALGSKEENLPVCSESFQCGVCDTGISWPEFVLVFWVKSFQWIFFFISWSNNSIDLFLILAFTMPAVSSLVVLPREVYFLFISKLFSGNCNCCWVLQWVFLRNHFLFTLSRYYSWLMCYLSTPPNHFLFQTEVIYYVLPVLKIL